MRTLRVMLIAFVFAFTLTFAQAQESAPQPAQSDKQAKDAKKKDKEKKDKEKKDKKNKQDDTADTSVFSDAAANDVLGMLRDGLEGHTQRLMLSAFDADKLDGYLTFEDQIAALFQRYAAFRVHFRITQSSTEGSRGVILAFFEMEEMPAAGGAPIRKANQMRFELERGRKGWRIVDFSPRSFFS